MDNSLFSSLGLSPEILKAVEKLGFEEASPIQAAAIPVLMTGCDVVGQSQTGSGKTAAFAIPAIEKVDAGNLAVQVLIMCPTRELATQVADEVHKLTVFKKGIHAVPIYGGASYERQFFELKKGVQIVIGTPGRLIDHLERGTLKLDQAHTVILDEADRMLDMGFREDIEKILESVPDQRQLVFFSATLPNQIKELIKRFGNNPQHVRIEQKEVSAPQIDQWFYETHSRMKMETLIRLIDYHGFRLGIIFCNTQRMVDELADDLIAQGFSADRLHGGIPQNQRTRVMDKFKKAEFEFLVATDVAARGIDVDDLELVVNYDLPYDAEDYVHRIGRTGRAGKKGMAVTFVTGRDIYKIQFIERFTKGKIRRGKIPTINEVEERRTDVLLEKVRNAAASEGAKLHSSLVERLLEEGLSSTDIAAGLFQIIIGGGGGGDEAPAVPVAMPAPQEDTREERKPAYADRKAPREDRRDSAPANDYKPPFKQEGSFEKKPFEKKPFEKQPFEKKAFEKKPAHRGEEGATLRRPPPGMAWVCLNVGRANDVGPRDVVDLIADRTGLPGRNIGMVNLAEDQSFAQVPESYLQKLKSDRVNAVWQDQPVQMRSWHTSPPTRTGGGGRSGKPRPRRD